MPYYPIRGDITNIRVDAIVNAANSGLLMGGGVCGAIFNAAGAEHMRRACERIGHCGEGEAVVTDGFDLPARHVIHTVGPRWRGGECGEDETLAACYQNALSLAASMRLTSVAFPLISSGIFGYPFERAERIARESIAAFLEDHGDMTVYLTYFDRRAREADEQFRDVQAYIAEHETEDALFSSCVMLCAESDEPDSRPDMSELLSRLEDASEAKRRYARGFRADAMPCAPAPKAKTGGMRRALDRVVSQQEETFSQRLLRLIDESGMRDPEVYKRANVDRKLFSKIRSDPYYRPRKSTALAFAVALGLNLDQTNDLLRSAGFALSHSSRFDLIIEYFITNRHYDIYEINEALFDFEQPLLGA